MSLYITVQTFHLRIVSLLTQVGVKCRTAISNIFMHSYLAVYIKKVRNWKQFRKKIWIRNSKSQLAFFIFLPLAEKGTELQM